jgi:mRNA interferase RelE/StbE
VNISYSKTFVKKFEKYDSKLQLKIFEAIEKIPDGDIKRLVGNDIPPVNRLRVSKYRVLFYMEDDVLQILKIDSRGDVYK